MIWDQTAVRVFGFLGEPAQMILAHQDFAFSLRERLAVFTRNDVRNLGFTAYQLIGYAVQDRTAVLHCACAPGGEGLFRIRQGLLNFCHTDSGNAGERLRRRGVDYFKLLAALLPLATDIAGERTLRDRILFHCRHSAFLSQP